MTLQKRWVLTTTLPIVGAFAFVVGATREILLHAAEVNARYWLTGAFENTFPVIDEEPRAALRAGAGALQGRNLDATHHVRDEVLRPATVANSLLYTLRGPDGTLLDGEDCPPPPARRRDAPVLATCNGLPAWSLSVRQADPAGAELVLWRPLDAAWLSRVARATQTEALLLDANGIVEGTVRDRNGELYAPVLTDLEGVELRPGAGTFFGKAEMRGGEYAGIGYSPGDRGSTALPVYVAASRVAPDADLWLVLLVPQHFLTTGATYATWYVTGTTTLITAALVLLIGWLARRATRPLLELSLAASRVQAGDLGVHVRLQGAKEIDEVGEAFNRMLGSIRESRRELAQVSHLGGMAEVATGVLHNVGNILTSVNVSADLLQQRIAGVRSDRLSQAAELLESHSEELPVYLTEDPRGRVLPAYLQQAARAVHRERERMLAEAAELKQNIERMKSVISTQQAYAKTVSNRAPEHLDAVIEDTLRLVQPSFDTHRITVTREYADLDPVTLDAPRVTQVLANLLQNAKDALRERPPGERNVRVRTVPVPGAIRIEVEDDGVGIAQADLPRLFTFGHTTKVDGHGFGLHMSALSAKAMGGSLTCRSAGLGQGATFVLELPVDAATGPRERCAS